MIKISEKNLAFQKKIFMEVLEPVWQNLRLMELSKQQLKAAGFDNIQFYCDTQKIFYTFEAIKL